MDVKNFFYDVRHMERYLCDSVVFHKDSPFLVTDIYSRHTVEAQDLSQSWEAYRGRDRDIPHIKLPVKELVFKTPPLGFMNLMSTSKDGVQYNYAIVTYRTPSRMWKVGINRNSFHVNILERYEYPNIPINFYNPGFVEMCKGVFPSLQSACDRTAPNFVAFTPSVAVSKSLAVGHHREEGRRWVFYKDLKEPIGFVDVSRALIVSLQADFFYLQQRIEQEGFPCQLQS